MSAPPPLNSLSGEALAAQLSAGALRYRVGPFQITAHSDIPTIAALLHRLYGDCPVGDGSAISDFQISLRRPRSLRRWLRPQAEFIADDEAPFAPLPLASAFPLLEWGFNWCVATTAHQYLMLHAAAIERNGKAVLMPAFPNSGKSTLCAALVHRGWRLLSDEFGLVHPNTRSLVPFPRCIPLKNASIELIRAFAPAAVIGPTFSKTRKGDVAHLKPPAESILRAGEEAQAAYVVFPRYGAGAETALRPISKAKAFMKLSTNSFNYAILGAKGFHTVASIIEASECLLFQYSNLEEAIRVFDDL